MAHEDGRTDEDIIESTDSTDIPGSPQSEIGQDNDYTRLDETGIASLDEENDREVASRGGLANLTQDVEAGNETEQPDDAKIRSRELPIQNLDNDA